LRRDEHNKSKGNNRFTQMPKNQLTRNIDVEYSAELADQDDKKAQKRAFAAESRVKKK